jgi:2'-5' RNA ligase
VYSLNAPVPGSVQRLASDLQGELLGFDAIRERHTLVVKRFGDLDPAEYAAVEERARRELEGAPACEAEVAGFGVFERPPTGPAPVVYLAVESPGLQAIHKRLVAEFDRAGDIEGEGYTPHVTLARGGDWETARRLADREIEPVRWSITSLAFWDGRFGERISTISLPA